MILALPSRNEPDKPNLNMQLFKPDMIDEILFPVARWHSSFIIIPNCENHSFGCLTTVCHVPTTTGASFLYLSSFDAPPPIFFIIA